MAKSPQPIQQEWMIYGANGYSGRLIAREAVRRGHKPVLAGRNAAALEDLAVELGLSWRVFGLEQADSVAHALADMALVVNCAGPFSATAETMMDACLHSQTHYLDITGEIQVFEAAKGRDSQARKAGVVLLPGTGFDVIPTDCLARLLADKMPDAQHLSLGFAGGNSLSPGTAKTTVEGMREGVKVRRHGSLETRANGFCVRHIDFGQGPRQATPIPWGDISTAFTSTGIPNITVFVPASKRTLKAMRMGNWLRPLLRLGLVQNFLKGRIAKKVHGPNASKREQQRMQVWGEVVDADGNTLSARVDTPNGYQMTSYGPVFLAEHILSHADLAGYYTPSMMMGGAWLETLPGVQAVRWSQGEQSPLDSAA